MIGAGESSKDTGPMLPGFETCETATEPVRPWPTPSGSPNKNRDSKPAPSYLSGGHGWSLRAAINAEGTFRSSTSSAAASPASPSVTLADVAANPIAAGFGLSSTESFAKLNPDGSWSKMCLGFAQWRMPLDGEGDSLEEYSETWPKRGTMRSGSTYPLPTLERPTSENESSLWPTPQVHETGGQGTPSWKDLERQKGGQQTRTTGVVIQRKLENEVPLQSLEDEQKLRDGGALNPTFVCWLMGFPKGWTELEG